MDSDKINKIKDIININAYELRTYFPQFNDEELVYLLTNKEMYAILCEDHYKVEFLVDYLSESKPHMLVENFSMDFWKEYAKQPEIYGFFYSLQFRPIREQLFTDEVISELMQDGGFRKNLFKSLDNDVRKDFVHRFLNNLDGENNLDILVDILPYIYSDNGPYNSVVDNSIFVSYNSKGISEPVSERAFSRRVNDYENKVSIAQYFENPKIREEFLNDFGLLSGLSVEDRTTLYSTLKITELSQFETINIKKLLYNGYLVQLPKEYFKDSMFVTMLRDETSIVPFRRIIKTLKFTNEEETKLLLAKKDEQLDEMAFFDNKIKKSSFPIAKYNNKEEDNLLEIIMYRYFKMCSDDIFTATKLIGASLKSLSGTEDRLSKEGANLINALINIVNTISQRKENNFALSKFHAVKDATLLLKLKKAADEYIKKHGEINLDRLVDACRQEFASSVQDKLTTTQTEGVVRKNISGKMVYDITDCDDFLLLVHSTNEVVTPKVEKGNETLVSMSLLDNNHLETFIEDGFVLGFDMPTKDMLIHALICDAGTGFDVAAKSLMYRRISSSAPIYTDLDSFLSLTLGFNELKIKPQANALNENGEEIMKPAYLLYKSNDLSHIPQNIIDKAEELGVDIYVINTELCKKKEYSPVVKEKEISYGSFIEHVS